MTPRLLLALCLGTIPALLLPACGDTFYTDDDYTYGEDDDGAPDDDSAGDDDTADDDAGDDDGGSNQAPVAEAGNTVFVDLGDTAHLDGSASFDPDGDPLDYLWEIISEPQGSNVPLAGADSVNPSLTPDVDGVYEIKLTVTDPGGLQGADVVSVWVAAGNQPPIADAGVDQNVTQGDTVDLNGTASVDPNGDPLDFWWSFTTYPGAAAPALSDPTSPTPTFDADDIGVYILELVVSDGQLSSAPDDVLINAQEGSSDCFECAAYLPDQPWEIAPGSHAMRKLKGTALVAVGCVAFLLVRRRSA